MKLFFAIVICLMSYSVSADLRLTRPVPFFFGSSQEDSVNIWPIYYSHKDFNSIMWPIVDWDKKGFTVRPLISYNPKDYIWCGPYYYNMKKNFQTFAFIVTLTDDLNYYGPVWHSNYNARTNKFNCGFFPIFSYYKNKGYRIGPYGVDGNKWYVMRCAEGYTDKTDFIFGYKSLLFDDFILDFVSLKRDKELKYLHLAGITTIENKSNYYDYSIFNYYKEGQNYNKQGFIPFWFKEKQKHAYENLILPLYYYKTNRWESKKITALGYSQKNFKAQTSTKNYGWIFYKQAQTPSSKKHSFAWPFHSYKEQYNDQNTNVFSWYGPYYSSQNNGTKSQNLFPILFTKSNPKTQTSQVNVGLFMYHSSQKPTETKKALIWPMYYHHSLAQKYDFTSVGGMYYADKTPSNAYQYLLPFYVYKTDYNQSYRITPLGGSGYNKAKQATVRNYGGFLYHSYKSPEEQKSALVWPFYYKHSLKQKYDFTSVGGLYYANKTPNNAYQYFAPFYFYKTDFNQSYWITPLGGHGYDKNKHAKLRNYGGFLYHSYQSETEKNRAVFWPFYYNSWSVKNHQTNTYLTLGGLYHKTTQNTNLNLQVFPFYTYIDDDYQKYTRTLFGSQTYTKQIKEQKNQFGLFVYRSSLSPTSKSKAVIWPFYYKSWSCTNNITNTYFTAGALYHHSTQNNNYSTRLFPLYKFIQKDNKTERLSFFHSYSKGSDGHLYYSKYGQFLYGMIDNKTKKEKYSWPFYKKGYNFEEKKAYSSVGLLYYNEKDSAGQDSILFPLYRKITNSTGKYFRIFNYYTLKNQKYTRKTFLPFVYSETLSNTSQKKYGYKFWRGLVYNVSKMPTAKEINMLGFYTRQKSKDTKLRDTATLVYISHWGKNNSKIKLAPFYESEHKANYDYLRFITFMHSKEKNTTKNLLWPIFRTEKSERYRRNYFFENLYLIKYSQHTNSSVLSICSKFLSNYQERGYSAFNLFNFHHKKIKANPIDVAIDTFQVDPSSTFKDDIITKTDRLIGMASKTKTHTLCLSYDKEVKLNKSIKKYNPTYKDIPQAKQQQILNYFAKQPEYNCLYQMAINAKGVERTTNICNLVAAWLPTHSKEELRKYFEILDPFIYSYHNSTSQTKFEVLLYMIKYSRDKYSSKFNLFWALYERNRNGKNINSSFFPYMTWKNTASESKFSFGGRLFSIGQKKGDYRGTFFCIPWGVED